MNKQEEPVVVVRSSMSLFSFVPSALLGSAILSGALLFGLFLLIGQFDYARSLASLSRVCLALFPILTLLLFALLYWKQRLQLAHTEYRFFSDHLEHSAGWLSTRETSVDYGSIFEITLNKGILQKRFRKGDITIAFKGFEWVEISNVCDVDQVYSRIKLLVSQCKHGQRANAPR